jgi:hypothetical protein
MGVAKILFREQHRDLIPKSLTNPKKQTKLRNTTLFSAV